MVERVFKIGMVMAILLTTFTGCQRQNLLNKVKAYVDAANRHDLEVIDAAITDDIVFELNGSNIAAGKGQFKIIQDNDAGFNTILEFVNCRQEGNTVICEAIERNDFLKAAGINELYYASEVITFKNGLIQKISANLSSASATAQDEFTQPFILWLKENRPEEFAKVMSPDGKYKWGRESAVIMVKLAGEYSASKK